MSSTAFDELKKHAARERSGEMIVASNEIEVHVYLQQGRVAWATSSKARFAFARYLANHCGVERDMFRQVIDECQRTKKPLGETLIAWKLATPEQVRAALRSQVVAALGELDKINDVRDLFLERGEAYREYTREMTFDIDDLERDLRGQPEDNQKPDINETVRLLADRRRDLLWALTIRDGAVATRHVNMGRVNETRAAAVLPALVETEGTHLAVLHEPCGSVVGVPMPDGSSLWCAVQTDGNVGAMIHELEKIAGRKPPAGAGLDSSTALDSIRSPGLVGACAPLESALQKTPELAAAFVRKLTETSLSVVRRQNFPLDPHESIAQGFSDMMADHDTPVVDTTVCPPGVVWDEGSIGLRLRINGFWYCSSRTPTICLWLILTGDTNLGFCQALLDTLVRQVAAALSRS